MENLQRHTKALYSKLCSELKVSWKLCHTLMPAVQFALNNNTQGQSRDSQTPMQMMTRAPRRGALDAIVTGTTFKEAKVTKVTRKAWRSVRKQLQNVQQALDAFRPQTDAADKKKQRRQKHNRGQDKLRKAQPLPRPRKGDLVLVARPEMVQNKFEFRWTGPWQILGPHLTGLEVMSSRGGQKLLVDGWPMQEPFDVCSHVYDVCFLGQPEVTNKFHAARMKPFCAAEIDLPASMVDMAQHDHQMFIITGIKTHVFREDGELRFTTTWLGFDDTDDLTFEHVYEAGDQVKAMLWEYLRKHKHEHEKLDNAFQHMQRDRTRRAKNAATKRKTMSKDTQSQANKKQRSETEYTQPPDGHGESKGGESDSDDYATDPTYRP